jgi:hypothetical protein
MEQVTRNITKRDGAALYQTVGAVWKFADTRVQQRNPGPTALPSWHILRGYDGHASDR